MNHFRLRAVHYCAALVFGLLALVPASSRVSAAQVPESDASTVVNAPDVQTLDHFWCYKTSSTLVNEQVGLKDQFTTDVIQHTVGAPTHFCNPVKKRHGDLVSQIIDRNAHLILYGIGVPEAKILDVQVKNQFGKRQLRVFGPARTLAVPTKKNNQPAPTNLDHFKCYRAKGEAIQAQVGLKDQFQQAQNLIVGRPVLLCNPTLKVHKQNTFQILHPKEHLVCYKVTGVNFTQNAQTANQFRTEALTVSNPNLLCVPSRKEIIVN